MADNVTLIPSRFEFYDESARRMAGSGDMGDAIAKIVMTRFRRAAQFKATNSIYQGKSTVTLLNEAEMAMEKRYTVEQSAAFEQAFGMPCARFLGMTASKVRAIADWKTELVAQDPGALIRIVPTPKPRLPEASVARIKEQIKDELVNRLMAAGVGTPEMLIQVGSNRLHKFVKDFLDSQASALRQLESARIASVALSTAGEVQTLVRDLALEGDFRDAYTGFSFNQVKYGLGILRFPYWQRRVVLSDKQTGKGRPAREMKVIPTFTNVSPWNFFVTPDGPTAETVTACMEYREISKTTLVGLLRRDEYDHDAIKDVLDRYNNAPTRTWLFPEASVETEQSEAPTYWEPDDVIAVIYHEGFVSGADLQAHGLTSYDSYQTYSVRAEICGGRCIRIEVVDPVRADARSYAVTKYDDLGPGVWKAAGVPAILHDAQSRINMLYRVWESNVDESMRPPKLVNPDSFKNPNDALNIAPGVSYQVNDMYTGMGGQVPEPVRTIRSVSAQYQILYPIIQQMVRAADMEVGVPDLADMSTFGRGSLGELSARVSQAVRRVRSAAFSEDRGMKPIWQGCFEYVLDNNPELVENVDLDMNYLGIVGLLAQEQERQAKMSRLSLIERGTTRGILPQDVEKFAYADLMRDLGVPTEALGVSDPLTDRAVAEAMSQGQLSGGTGTSLVPQLDGRSGNMANVQGAVAAPNGASQIAPPPSL